MTRYGHILFQEEQSTEFMGQNGILPGALGAAGNRPSAACTQAAYVKFGPRFARRQAGCQPAAG